MQQQIRFARDEMSLNIMRKGQFMLSVAARVVMSTVCTVLLFSFSCMCWFIITFKWFRHEILSIDLWFITLNHKSHKQNYFFMDSVSSDKSIKTVCGSLLDRANQGA